MPAREYLDVNLHLEASGDPSFACRVSLLPSPAVGEILEPTGVPAGSAPSPASLQSLAAKTITPLEMVDLGRRLGECLLPAGGVRELFQVARTQAGYDGGLRLRLFISDPALRLWPWEFAYLDPTQESRNDLSGFLSLDPRISIVRHEPLAAPHLRIDAKGSRLVSPRLMIVASQPVDTPRLRIDQEVDYLKAAFSGFEVDGTRLVLEEALVDVTAQQLEEYLRESQSVYLFHFTGHGEMGAPQRDPLSRGGKVQPGTVLLVKDGLSKRAAPLEASTLARWMLRAGVRLAFLSACQTGERQAGHSWAGVAGSMVRHGVPAVVAMQHPVEDVASVNFTRAFYGALFSGLTLDEAVSVGRLAMVRPVDQPYCFEWGVPVLYSRLGGGALFPEQAQGAGTAARIFRKTIDFQIAEIAQGGSLTGVDVKVLSGELQVKARLGSVGGSATVAGVGEVKVDADLDIQAQIDRIERGGTLTVFKTDEL